MARRAGAVRAGPFLRGRRLYGGADRPLHRHHDVFVLVPAGAVTAGLVAFLVGLLLARYRDIFFAMLSLAMSMILYGALVKTESLGSTDGFNVRPAHISATRRMASCSVCGALWLVLGSCAIAALLVEPYFSSSPACWRPDPRQRDPRRVPRSLGQSAGPLEAVIAGVLGRIGRRVGGTRDRPCRSEYGVLDDVRRLRLRDHPGRRRLGRGGLRRLAGLRIGALLRGRCLPGAWQITSDRAAADDPIPTRGARLALTRFARKPGGAP